MALDLPTVLVVEDDEDTLDALHLFLEEEGGYAVMDAKTGPQAIQALTSAPVPMLVLLDHHLPGLQEPLINFIARTPLLLNRHAYVLVSASKDVLKYADRWPVIEKPFSLDTLSTVLQTTWTTFQQRDA